MIYVYIHIYILLNVCLIIYVGFNISVATSALDFGFCMLDFESSKRWKNSS